MGLCGLQEVLFLLLRRPFVVFSLCGRLSFLLAEGPEVFSHGRFVNDLFNSFDPLHQEFNLKPERSPSLSFCARPTLWALYAEHIEIGCQILQHIHPRSFLPIQDEY